MPELSEDWLVRGITELNLKTRPGANGIKSGAFQTKRPISVFKLTQRAVRYLLAGGYKMLAPIRRDFCSDRDIPVVDVVADDIDDDARFDHANISLGGFSSRDRQKLAAEMRDFAEPLSVEITADSTPEALYDQIRSRCVTSDGDADKGQTSNS
jgi:hypothetical protein